MNRIVPIRDHEREISDATADIEESPSPGEQCRDCHLPVKREPLERLEPPPV
jgi:hypothetical protein